MVKKDEQKIIEEIQSLSSKTDKSFEVIRKDFQGLQQGFQGLQQGFQGLKQEFTEEIQSLSSKTDKSFETIQKDFQGLKQEFTEVKKLAIQTNNSLQGIKQDILLFKEENKKEHEEMKRENKKEHEELKDLILRGDEGAVELIVDKETEQEVMDERITILEKDVRRIKQKVFA